MQLPREIYNGLPFLNLNCGCDADTYYVDKFTSAASSCGCMPPRRRPKEKPLRHSDSLMPFHIACDGREAARILDAYVMCDPLGKGTYGEVYSAKNKITGAPRAVKVVDKKIFAKTKMEYVWREANVLQQVDHPNLVRLYESFEDTRQISVVLELCVGGDLLEIITSPDKRLAEPEVPLLFVQILAALRHLHSHGIVHRDVKPENYLFTHRSDVNPPKVCPLKLIDFGLSRHASFDLELDSTDTGTDSAYHLLTPRIGTGEYMAPEIAAGQHADRLADRADMWSAGVVLHAMLTGHFPNKNLSAGPPGHYFKAPFWDKYSPDCRSLLRQVLHYKPDQRLSACLAMEHPWLARAAGLEDFTLVQSIPSAVRAFAALPALKRLVLVAAAREVNDCETYNIRMLWHNLELECSGVLSKDTLRSMLERALDDSKPSTLNSLADMVEALYECMDSLDTTSSGTIDWTEFVAACLCSEDNQIWSVPAEKHIYDDNSAKAFEDRLFKSGAEEATELRREIAAHRAELEAMSMQEVKVIAREEAHITEVEIGIAEEDEKPKQALIEFIMAKTQEESEAFGPALTVASRAHDLLSHGNGMVSCKMPAASRLISTVTRSRHSSSRPTTALKERRWFLT